MWESHFRYYAAVESVDGVRLGDVRLNLDWVPALRWAEWAEFEEGVKSGGTPAANSAHPVIEPIWSPEGEPPYVGGVKIRRAEEGAKPIAFPLSYFSSAVVNASSELVASGSLVAGQRFEYKIFALADAQRQRQANLGFDVVAVDQPPPIEVADLASLMTEAGEDSENGGIATAASSLALAETMSIFIPQIVLDEATELARTVGEVGTGDEVETGGILVGKLYRDRTSGILFSRITGQLPAEHTIATRHSLRFTPETWASVDQVMRLRATDEVARNEIVLGWWHVHGWFCEFCPPENRALCAFSSPAFSLADRDVHREVFQKPWSIALLLSFLGEERPSYDVFAWSQGQIEAVKFYTLPDRSGATGATQ